MVQAETNKKQLGNFIKGRALVYLQKNADYGDSFNRSLDKYGIVAYQVRAEDKLNRFEQLMQNSNHVKNESITDTILDLFNYSAMAKAWEEDDTDLLNVLLNLEYLADEGEFRHFIKYLKDKQVMSMCNQYVSDLLVLLAGELHGCS